MKKLNQWLNANKISLNVQETELVIFKHLREKLCSEIKSNELEKVFVPPFQSLKYIFVKTDQNSNLKLRVNDIAAKLKEERLYYLRSGTLPLLPH